MCGKKGTCRSKGRLIATLPNVLTSMSIIYIIEGAKVLTDPEWYDSWPRTRGCSACESERPSVLRKHVTVQKALGASKACDSPKACVSSGLSSEPLRK